MSRQARLVLVLGVIAIVAVVALAMVARQYTRFTEPERSIADLPPHLSGANLPEVGPDAGYSPGTGDRGAIPDDTATAMDVPAAPEAGDDPVITSQWPGFVAGRQAILDWVDENPHAARDLTDEATGYQLGRERIKMHTFKVIQIRVKRAKAATTEGLDEDAYRRIREQYRLWKDGGDADPAWAAWFDGDPERAAEVDLDRYEPLDF